MCWCQGQKSKNLQFFPWGLPQQPADSRWGNTTESRHRSVPSQQQLRCCWLHFQANPILPVHILWEDACLALSPVVLLPCSSTRVAFDYREICPDTATGFLNCVKHHTLDSIYRVSSESKTYNNSLEWTGTKIHNWRVGQITNKKGERSKIPNGIAGISNAKGL